MRIISGTARGIPIQAPKGRDVRPTLDRVRESVFNILRPYLDDECVFADLFCGTGANGLEALSRGARKAIFVDASPESLACARGNAEKTQLMDRAQFTRASLPDRLQPALAPATPITVMYADPPFDFADYEALLAEAAHADVLAEGGILAVEHSSRVNLPESSGGVECFRAEKFGETTVRFYRQETD